MQLKLEKSKLVNPHISIFWFYLSSDAGSLGEFHVLTAQGHLDSMNAKSVSLRLCWACNSRLHYGGDSGVLHL